MPAEPVVQEADLHFTVYDDYAAKTYEINETINSSGIYLEFEPAVLTYTCWTNERSDRHRLEIQILNETYVLSCLNSSHICLASEENHSYLRGSVWLPCSPEQEIDCRAAHDMRSFLVDHSCDLRYINVDYLKNMDMEFWEDGVYYLNLSGKIFILKSTTDRFSIESKAIFCELAKNCTCDNEMLISVGEDIEFTDGILHLWGVSPFAGQWAEISYFSEIIVLGNGLDGVKLNWEDGGYVRKHGGTFNLGENITYAGETFTFIDWKGQDGRLIAKVCKNISDSYCENEFYMEEGEQVQLSDGSFLRLWKVHPNQPSGASWIEAYVMVTNPSLKSIYIPATSSAYKKLVG